MHYRDSKGKTGGRLVYGDKLDLFDDCGYTFEWPYNARLDIPGVIPVHLDSEYTVIDVGQYHPDSEPVAHADNAILEEAMYQECIINSDE